MTQPKVLLTGGAGFIGSHLAKRWASEGARIVVLDSLRSGSRDNLTDVSHEFVEGDVRDVSVVRKAMEGCRYVHHLAAMVSVPESMEKPGEAEEINAGGTLAVLEEAKKAGVEKVVFSSTCAIYGMVDRPAHRESDAPAPASPYAISKLAGEGYMNLFDESYGTPTAALRYFNVYGPGQDPNSAYAAAVAAFASRAKNQQQLMIYGDGEQTRDFVFIDDVVEANVRAAKSVCGLYNIGCGERLTIKNLAEQIVAQSASNSEIVHAEPRAGDVRHSRADMTKTKEAFDWQPSTPLANGLAQTLETFSKI